MLCLTECPGPAVLPPTRSKGATLGCFKRTCRSSYHLACARKYNCLLQVSSRAAELCVAPGMSSSKQLGAVNRPAGTFLARCLALASLAAPPPPHPSNPPFSHTPIPLL